jgi:hypothetical protein
MACRQSFDTRGVVGGLMLGFTGQFLVWWNAHLESGRIEFSNLDDLVA